MPNCLFCSIVDKTVPAEIMYEDGAVVAILDIHPRAPGHTVVIPKVHSETILDMPDRGIGPVFEAVRTVTERLKRALDPDGFTIGINHGRHAGQAVDHLHIHVMPRWKDDGGGSLHGVVENPPKESIHELKKKIINAG